MKTSFLLANIFAIIAIATACKQHYVENLPTIVKGNVFNPHDELLSLSYQHSSVKDTLDAQGQFEFIIPLTKPGFVTFVNGKTIARLYLTPGTRLQIAFESDAFSNSVKFEGPLALENKTLTDLSKMNNALPPYNEIMNLEENEFLIFMDSLQSQKTHRLNLANPGNSHFRKLLLHDFLLFSAEQKMYYPNFHRHYGNLDSFTVSKDYYKFQDEINLNDSSLLDLQSFTTYCDMYLNQKMATIYDDENNERSKTSSFTLYHEILDEEISSVPVKREVKYNWLNLYFTYCPDSIKNVIVNDWKAMSPPTYQLTRIDSLLEKWNRIASGRPAPDFRGLTLQGDTVELSDLIGTNLYIDIWATWCKPCIAEHPALEKLQNELKDEKVTFLSISIDTDKEAWENMVVKKNLGGLQLYAQEAWESAIVKGYLIEGIPRFIIIDAEGKIVNVNAGRPSGSAREELRDLLKSSPTI